MQATPRASREVCPAMAPSSGMHSRRGLLRMLSPTHTASIALELSAVIAISIRSFGCMPLVRTARLDNVRPKVVFGGGMLASIRREAGLLSRESGTKFETQNPKFETKPESPLISHPKV